jgi:hypothetical protein
MKFYKLTENAVLVKYNPEQKNSYGGYYTNIVRMLKKNDIILVNKVEPNTLDKSPVKGTNYYTSKNNFIAVTPYFNPLSEKINAKDVGVFAIQTIQEPRTLIILGILGVVVIGTKALINKI